MEHVLLTVFIILFIFNVGGHVYKVHRVYCDCPRKGENFSQQLEASVNGDLLDKHLETVK